MVPTARSYNRTADEAGVKDHPKGCGCVAAGLDGAGGGAAALALALGCAGILARRRRDRAADAL